MSPSPNAMILVGPDQVKICPDQLLVPPVHFRYVIYFRAHTAMSRFEAVQGLTEEGAPGLAVTGVLCGTPLPERTVLSGRTTLGYAMHLHRTRSKRDLLCSFPRIERLKEI